MSDLAAPTPAPDTLLRAMPRPVISRLLLLIGVGIFVTTIGLPRQIGSLPLNNLLKNQLHYDASTVARFWMLASFARYIKPLFGMLCDSVPLFGARRRGWLVLGSVLGGFLWLTIGFVPHTYGWLLGATALIYAAIVLAGSAIGGLMVQTGQSLDATGRLAGLRNGAEGVITLVKGPASGQLATLPLAWTGVVGACLQWLLIPVTIRCLHEPPLRERDRDVWARTREHLVVISRSRSVWMATALLFLIYMAPGLQTPMYYYQQNVLHFDNVKVGRLDFVTGVGSLIGVAIYAWVCRRIPLRPLLYVGVGMYAFSNLLFLFYRSLPTAIAVDFANGLFGAFAVLPLYDLCARAAPKGSESFAFGLEIALRDISLYVVSDPLGSWLFDHGFDFHRLVWINAGTTALVLCFVPFLPRFLTERRDGDPHPTPA